MDLDGTLAIYTPGQVGIGEPVPLMVERVKRWVAQGCEVRIVTARVGMTESYYEREYWRGRINEWCWKHLGMTLQVTASKDYNMLRLWDDRCVQVVTNTGQRVDGCSDGADA